VLHFNWQRKTMLKLLVLFLLTVILTLTASEDFYYRINDGLDFRNSNSAQGHFRQWADAGEAIAGSPIFGWGTQKATMTTIVDNEYALYTRRYGLIGLALYLTLFFKPFRVAWRRVKEKAQMVYGEFGDHQTLLCMAFTAATLAVLIYNVFAGIFYNLQLMTFFSVFMGLVYGTLKRRSF